jgi:hypothetical protein
MAVTKWFFDPTGLLTWRQLTGWWTNAGHTVQAVALPAAAEQVQLDSVPAPELPTIVTPALAKAHLEIAHSVQDAIIQAYIDAAVDWIERECGIGLSSAVVEEQLDGGDYWLRPSRLPVTDLDTVEDSWSDAADYTAALDGDWRIMRANEDGSEIRALWPAGVKRWTVNYTGGYATLPPGLVLVILQLVGRMYHARAGQASDSGGGMTMNFGALAGGDLGILLRPFRRRSAGTVGLPV